VDITPEGPAPQDRSRPDAAAGTKDRDDAPPVDRLITLSDGVVAIALTLLVLQIAVPAESAMTSPDSASALADKLSHGWAEWISYGISFYVIAQFWLMHHRVFRRFAAQQDGLATWNFVFLFAISVMPFTSDLLGKFSENPLAVDIFALNLLLANVATQGMLEFGERHELTAEGKRRDPNLSRMQALTSGVIILISIVVAWYSPTGAKFCWLGFALVPRVGAVIVRARRARRAGHPGGGHSRPR
jgi:uncharacterized membrane protein